MSGTVIHERAARHRSKRRVAEAVAEGSQAPAAATTGKGALYPANRKLSTTCRLTAARSSARRPSGRSSRSSAAATTLRQ